MMIFLKNLSKMQTIKQKTEAFSVLLFPILMLQQPFLQRCTQRRVSPPVAHRVDLRQGGTIRIQVHPDDDVVGQVCR